MVAPCKAGGGCRPADKSSLRTGERSTQESSLSPALAGGGADRGARGEEEHCHDTDGKGNAGVSELRHSLVRGCFPRGTTTEEDKECGCFEEVRA